jgi:dye decolorizing peroxidase
VTGERQAARRLTRRRFLLGAGALAGAGAAAAVELDARARDRGRNPPPVALGAQPRGLPARQHAWDATLTRDADGNPVAPRYDRLLFFGVNGSPSLGHASRLEAALRTLERRFPWGPQGLLFVVAYGPRYFTHALGRAAPIPAATALSDFELPAIDRYDLVIHLAGDDPRRLRDIEAALVRGASLPGADGPLDLSAVLTWRETRTGFAGAGLPAAHQDVGGIPASHPVAAGAPLFMGFKSSLKRNQASEDAVTIPSGPFAEGTTMHVSYMRLRLDSWYGDLNAEQRVARMYAPQVTPSEVSALTTDAESDPRRLPESIHRFGVIGHAQACARARRHGKPIILRRDFDSTDGGQAGLQFVALQRAIADFVAVRTAMNQTSAQLQNPAITDTVNNGINEYIFVLRRGNYIVPSRTERSFPMLSA